MALRASWKGFLKVSLVNIPVKVFPATGSAEAVSFNKLHKDCKQRLKQKMWCEHCHKEVASYDQASGYEYEPGKYLVMSDADLEKVRPPSTKIINLTTFIKPGTIDTLYMEKPYYLAPNGPDAASAFAVIRDGMAGNVGIGRMSIYRREYVVAVMPREKGLLLWTLRAANEVRAMGEVSEYNDLPSTLNTEEVALAKSVVSTFQGELDLASFRDAYQESLRQIISAMVAGREVTVAEEEKQPIVGLMDALKKSLDEAAGQKKVAKMAKATVQHLKPVKKGKKSA